MKQTEKEKRQQQYEDYVKKKTPVHNVYLNMAKSFITGGIICVIGQGIYNYCEMIGLSKDHCSNWTSLYTDLTEYHPHRSWTLSKDRKMGRSWCIGSHHRLCQLGGSSGDRV